MAVTPIMAMLRDNSCCKSCTTWSTDSRLLEKSRQQLVKVAEEHGISFRQNYNRTALRLAARIGR